MTAGVGGLRKPKRKERRLAARYEHLPIYRAAFDLAVHMETIVRHFSRYHKLITGFGEIVGPLTKGSEQRGLLLTLVGAARMCLRACAGAGVFRIDPGALDMLR